MCRQIGRASSGPADGLRAGSRRLRADELEDHDDAERRLAEWQCDSPVAVEWCGTVDLGGILKLLGDGSEELAQQEDFARAQGQPTGKNQRYECIEKSQFPPDKILGNKRHFCRKQHSPDDHSEEERPCRELNTRQRVPDQRGAEDGADHIQNSDK